MDENTEVLLTGFRENFGTTGGEVHVFFAPGRVNLIGEHTDYNGGFVLPCSLEYGTWLAIRFNGSDRIRMVSMNYPGPAEIKPRKTFDNYTLSWVNYPLGVLNEFALRSFELPGMELCFYGDIPNDAGLSSSASIEMVTATALNEILLAGLSTMDLIRLCQHAENEFVGMKCGIMDQFAVGTGKKNHALFLNCETLEYKMVPLILKDYALMIINSGKKRELASSGYNQRRSECERAVEIISRHHKINYLGNLKESDLPWVDEILNEEVLRKRVRHVVTENARVLKGVEYLPASEIAGFGRLMSESHKSLKEDYQVSCPELDLLVEMALQAEGVAGSRMTGGGFGGCTVTFVKKDSASPLMNKIKNDYPAKTGLQPEFFTPGTGESVKKIGVFNI
ncbi:MAG: galactokinase [Bacteroidales bacterium]|nr:galactokinase [Bacteroidales bacterium]